MEAAQAAARPITWLHGLAGACAAGIAVAAIGVAWPSLRDFARQILGFVGRARPEAAGVLQLFAFSVEWSVPLLLAVGACALLAPIALYFALVDE
jgi:hypothetical protein